MCNMFKMSFYDGTLDRNKLKEIIQSTEKNIVYTYGLAFRHPTTYRVPVSVEKALQIVECESLLDAKEEEGCIHLNAFSGNDMW